MAEFPKPFPTPSEFSLNVDFQDVATGRGYIEFFAGELDTGKVLSTINFYATFTKLKTILTNVAADEDFDVVIQQPISFQGDVIVTLPAYFQNKNVGNETPSSTVTVKLRKWDGTTETDLATDAVTVADTLTPGEIRGQIFTTKLTMPRTHFAKGETLRLTIAGTATGSAGEVLWIYRDPADRSVTTDAAYPLDTSKLNVQIPVVIDT